MGTFDLLRPGDAVDISADEAINPIAPDPIWDENIHRYELYAALLRGGDATLWQPYGVRHPITGLSVSDRSYLRRLPGESAAGGADAAGYTDHFVRRRDSSAHSPVSARIIWTYVDTVFRQEIDRSSVAAVLGSEILDDMDGCGTPASDWLANAYAIGLSQGWCLALVDAPSDVLASPSAYHEAGLRPYVQLYPPARVYQLERHANGRVASCLLHESATRYRQWTEDTWTLYDERGDVVAVGQHGLGRCPCELFVASCGDCADPLAPPGDSAIKAIALLDLQILQHSSLLDDLWLKTGFPFYHLKTDSTDQTMGNISLGAGMIFAHEADGAWQAPPESLAAGLRNHIDWLEGQALNAGGVHRRSQDSVEAHSGLALDWENAPIYATVHRWARSLRRWEIAIWRMMAGYLGRSDTDIASITAIYPDDFSSRPVEQDLGYAEQLTRIYGEAMPEWVKIGRDALIRRVVTRLVGHQRDVAASLPADLSPKDTEEIEPETVAPDTALNGAQVAAEVQIVTAVAKGELPRASGVAMLYHSFPISRDEAEEIMADAGAGFEIATKAEPSMAEPAMTEPPSWQGMPTPAIEPSDPEGGDVD